jgi:hypothetical protein
MDGLTLAVTVLGGPLGALVVLAVVDHWPQRALDALLTYLLTH